MQPGTAMCFLNFYTLVFWTPLGHHLVSSVVATIGRGGIWVCVTGRPGNILLLALQVLSMI